jgi:thiol-disulfide isomerase/thioredoxin
MGVDRGNAGTLAPDLPLETGPDGATETVADIVRAAGTPVLVNLWATWCTPCLKELPTLDRLAAETRGALKVVPVSQDMEGWRVVEPAFTAERYPHLQTRLESQMAFGAELGLRGLPVTILYDAEGREVWRYNGDRDWADAEARALIAEASPPTG